MSKNWFCELEPNWETKRRGGGEEEEEGKRRRRRNRRRRRKGYTANEKLNVSKSEMVLAPYHITPLLDYHPVRTASTNM